MTSKEVAAKHYASYHDGSFEDNELVVVGPLRTPIAVPIRADASQLAAAAAASRRPSSSRALADASLADLCEERADPSGIGAGLRAGLAETLWTTLRPPSPASSASVHSDESYSLGNPESRLLSDVQKDEGNLDALDGEEELPVEVDIAALAERARGALRGGGHKEFRYWVTESHRRAQGLAPFDCVDVIIGDLGASSRQQEAVNML